jgi:hypothetical protein
MSMPIQTSIHLSQIPELHRETGNEEEIHCFPSVMIELRLAENLPKYFRVQG